MRFALRRLNLRTGKSKTVTASDSYLELSAYVDGLRAERKAARNPDTGEYPPVIHGIVTIH